MMIKWFGKNKEIQLPTWLEKTLEVLKKIGNVLGVIGKWIFRLRGFFMAIPVMFGVTFLKLVTYEGVISSAEIAVLAVAMLVAYAVSMIAIKFLINFVKKHSFAPFGVYRIALGTIVLIYFIIR